MRRSIAPIMDVYDTDPGRYQRILASRAGLDGDQTRNMDTLEEADKMRGMCDGVSQTDLGPGYVCDFSSPTRTYLINHGNNEASNNNRGSLGLGCVRGRDCIPDRVRITGGMPRTCL